MDGTVTARWQFCRGELDITSDLYAREDADLVRAWDGDFCLIEVSRLGGPGTAVGVWVATGGDGDWTRLDGQEFATPGGALAAYMAGQPYEIDGEVA